ncbi:MAG: hypothetical protein AAF480_04460 [Actinomycetota bacterium]
MIVDVVLAAVLLTVFAIPLALTGWAFLDAASRPKWVWAFAGRRQVLWMCGIAFGLLTVIGGLAISGYYLVRVRTELAAVERGEFDQPHR